MSCTDRLGVLVHRRLLPLGPLGEELPPRLRGDDEDAGALVLLRVVDEHRDLVVVHALRAQVGLDRGAPLDVGVGDVLEEHQPEDDVLVLRGVHRAAQLVGRLPQRVLELLHRGGGGGLGALGPRGHGSGSFRRVLV
jgi:hypothetical protein